MANDFPGIAPTVAEVKQRLNADRLQFSANRQRKTVTLSVTRPAGFVGPVIDRAEDAFAVVGVAIGDEYPTLPGSNLRLAEYNVQEQRGTVGGWDIELTYETPSGGGGGPIQPDEPGFVEVNVTAELEFIDTYYEVPFAELPAQGNAPRPLQPIDTSPTDVHLIAIGGAPTSIPTRAIRADISVTLDTWPDFAFLTGFAGTRNISPFLGGVVGSVLYTGPTSSRISVDRWRITHGFVQDEFFHLRQAGTFNNDTGELRFASWVQPYRFLSEFANIGIPPLIPPVP